MYYEQRQKDYIHYPAELSRLRDEQDQQREHIYHEARHQELDESHCADTVNKKRFRMTFHQHSEEMHRQIYIYESKENLKVLLRFLTDMHTGTDMNKTHAAYSDTGSNEYDIYQIT